jgi:hypothetical protein
VRFLIKSFILYANIHFLQILFAAFDDAEIKVY